MNESFIQQDELLAVLEAILFASTQPVTTDRIQQVLQIPESQIEQALQQLQQRYNQKSHGIELICKTDGYRLITKIEHGQVVADFLRTRKTGLSNAAMEVLAIAAYNQPVTRAFIDQVAADFGELLRGFVASTLCANLFTDFIECLVFLFGGEDKFHLLGNVARAVRASGGVGGIKHAHCRGALAHLTHQCALHIQNRRLNFALDFMDIAAALEVRHQNEIHAHFSQKFRFIEDENLSVAYGKRRIGINFEIVLGHHDCDVIAALSEQLSFHFRGGSAVQARHNADSFLLSHLSHLLIRNRKTNPAAKFERSQTQPLCHFKCNTIHSVEKK